MTRRLISLAILLAAVAYGFYAWHAVRQAANRHDLAEAVWSHSLPDLAGKPQAFSQWRGKLLVINFWATWCPPCRREIPSFVKLQQQYGSHGLQFVGVAVDTPANVRTFVQEYRINYPILIGDLNATRWSQELGNPADALPYTVVISPAGKVLMTHLGGLDEQGLLPYLRQAM